MCFWYFTGEFWFLNKVQGWGWESSQAVVFIVLLVERRTKRVLLEYLMPAIILLGDWRWWQWYLGR